MMTWFLLGALTAGLVGFTVFECRPMKPTGRQVDSISSRDRDRYRTKHSAEPPSPLGDHSATHRSVVPEQILPNSYVRERWTILHRHCTDTPEPIEPAEDPHWTLTTHAGHGPECLYLLAALCRTSEVV
jgi:hypothetical protein